jgi:hypothetical protein
MLKEMRFLDIPDGDPLPRAWVETLDVEAFGAEIKLVEEIGPIFAGCALIRNGLWRLHSPIGYGQIANLIFLTLKNGNFLAIHGFTSKSDADLKAGLDLAAKRWADLM